MAIIDLSCTHVFDPLGAWGRVIWLSMWLGWQSETDGLILCLRWGATIRRDSYLWLQMGVVSSLVLIAAVDAFWMDAYPFFCPSPPSHSASAMLSSDTPLSDCRYVLTKWLSIFCPSCLLFSLLNQKYDVSDFAIGMGLIDAGQRRALKEKEKKCLASLRSGNYA